MERIGQILKKVRAEKGISLLAVERDTRIRTRYLEAIEAENWDVLPGKIYARGFLKNYCRYLEIDETPLLKAFDEVLTPELELTLPVVKMEYPQKPRIKMGLLLSVAALLFLVLFQVVYQSYLKQDSAKSNTPGINPKPVITQQNPEPAGQNPTEGLSQDNPSLNSSREFKTINLNFKVTQNKCWIEVKNDNRIIYQGTVLRGEEKVFTDLNKATFTLGNSGVVEVRINETSLGVLGKIGEVITKTFILENSELKEL